MKILEKSKDSFCPKGFSLFFSFSLKWVCNANQCFVLALILFSFKLQCSCRVHMFASCLQGKIIPCSIIHTNLYLVLPNQHFHLYQTVTCLLFKNVHRHLLLHRYKHCDIHKHTMKGEMILLIGTHLFRLDILRRRHLTILSILWPARYCNSYRDRIFIV